MSDIRAQQREVRLPEILGLLWHDRWLLAAVTLTTTVLAGIAAFAVTKRYEASIVVSPVSSTAGSGGLGGLGSMASQLGGLAALAGISVTGDSKKSESIAVLQSEALTSSYIADKNLLPVLFADQWDAEAKRWTETDLDEQPTLWTANQYFKRKVRRVKLDNKTGLVTLTISWKDARLAAQWANDLVRISNEYLRSKAIAESERNIAYLNSEAAKTDIVEARRAIYAILQDEINRAMLARGSEEYAFKIIDPAVPPQKAAYPQKLIWVAAGFFAGLVIAVLVAFARRAWF
jgi:uncharacterized protein involved in exopolysaccharide biosynthesis